MNDEIGSKNSSKQRLGQQTLELRESIPVGRVEPYEFEPIRGYPTLRWMGKRPFTSTLYYPAQHTEAYGPEVNGWRNKLYWGDNLQVMSHLLKQYRGRIRLVYIDPPFASAEDYERAIVIHSKVVKSDRSIFEEKQYADIWANDEYLQFMYERLILIRELLSEDGAIFVHCDWQANSTIRLIMDEVFGPQHFRNEIIWAYRSGRASRRESLPRKHDTILLYARSSQFMIRPQVERQYLEKPFKGSKVDGLGRNYVDTQLRDILEGEIIHVDGGGLNRYNVRPVLTRSSERTNYPTQKPKDLLKILCLIASDPNDIVLDCFLGSGTTGIAATELGRRFIGADINLGAVQLTTKRLLSVAAELQFKPPTLGLGRDEPTTLYTGFEVYNVNNYDIFRNPIEAKSLIIQALNVNPLQPGSLFDGELDGRMVKIMPVNRIATRQDLNELINGLGIGVIERRQAEHPTLPVEKITLVCMGHEPDLAATLRYELHPLNLDVEVVDILRDREDIQFKRDSEAIIAVRDGEIVVEAFYPVTVLAQLNFQKTYIEDWRELVDSIMIDWNYDGAIFQPTFIDMPKRNTMVKGRYSIPPDAGVIRVKITDILSESLEMEVDQTSSMSTSIGTNAVMERANG